MISSQPEQSARVTGLLTPRAHLLAWSGVLLAAGALVALVLQWLPVAGVLLVVLIALLFYRLTKQTRAAAGLSATAAQQSQPLVEELTQQLATTLSVTQVASSVLTMALRATHAEEALLALPVEVAHYMTLQLREGDEQVQMVHRSQTGASLIEQVLQRGQTMFNRDRTAVAVVLRHEYSIVGVLYVQHQTLTFTPTDAALLAEIAAPAAVSLHHARLLDDQQFQIDMFGHVQALTLRLANAIDRDAVARAILETTRNLLGVQEVALYGCESGRVEPLLSLHRDHFNDSPSEKRLTQPLALRAFASTTTEIARYPVTCIAVPVEHNGVVREILAAAFLENHTLRHRDLTTINLLASQTAAHFDTVELHQQVRAVSERLRVTINSARDGVLLLGQDGTLVECNPSAERLLGIDKEMFLGKHFVAMLFEMMKGNELSGLGYSPSQLTELARQLRLEPSNITRRQFTQINGSQKLHIEEIGSPVIDAENRIIGRLLVLRDVTEQKMLADFRDEITHMAVHDLRGPLTAVANGIDMTLKLGLTENADDNARILRIALDSAHGLMRLVDSLLDIARLESRRMPIKPQSVTAHELVVSAREMLANSITQAQVDVQTRFSDDLPMLHVDIDLTRRVLINLLDNAIRFTPQGKRVLISVVHMEPTRVRIGIADSGPGIPLEEHDLIFEQYRQSSANKPLRGSKGTGLGLTFCKLAIEAHGGSIWVESSETLPGACFVVSLPVMA